MDSVDSLPLLRIFFVIIRNPFLSKSIGTIERSFNPFGYPLFLNYLGFGVEFTVDVFGIEFPGLRIDFICRRFDSFFWILSSGHTLRGVVELPIYTFRGTVETRTFFAPDESGNSGLHKIADLSIHIVEETS
jgi:hypothetical protein